MEHPETLENTDPFEEETDPAAEARAYLDVITEGEARVFPITTTRAADWVARAIRRKADRLQRLRDEAKTMVEHWQSWIAAHARECEAFTVYATAQLEEWAHQECAATGQKSVNLPCGTRLQFTQRAPALVWPAGEGSEETAERLMEWAIAVGFTRAAVTTAEPRATAALRALAADFPALVIFSEVVNKSALKAATICGPDNKAVVEATGEAVPGLHYETPPVAFALR